MIYSTNALGVIGCIYMLFSCFLLFFLRTDIILLFVIPRTEWESVKGSALMNRTVSIRWNFGNVNNLPIKEVQTEIFDQISRISLDLGEHRSSRSRISSHI